MPRGAWAATQGQNKNAWLDLKENFTLFIKYYRSTVVISILLFQSLTFSSIGKRNACPPSSLQLNSGSNTNLQENFGGFPPNPDLKYVAFSCSPRPCFPLTGDSLCLQGCTITHVAASLLCKEG